MKLRNHALITTSIISGVHVVERGRENHELSDLEFRCFI